MTDSAAVLDVDATTRAVRALRDMVMGRRVAPGQQLRQDHLADALGLSRSPVREALRTLETEGLLDHLPNQGYFVVQLSSSEMRQIYLMRRLLETELYRTLRRPLGEELRVIRSIDAEIRRAVRADDVSAMLEANRRFHFTIFALSPLELISRHVERLWHQSESYRAAYLWLPEAQKRITAEHAVMLKRLEAHDLRGLVAMADRHRHAAETSVVKLLASQEPVDRR